MFTVRTVATVAGQARVQVDRTRTVATSVLSLSLVRAAAIAMGSRHARRLQAIPGQGATGVFGSHSGAPRHRDCAAVLLHHIYFTHITHMYLKPLAIIACRAQLARDHRGVWVSNA